MQYVYADFVAGMHLQVGKNAYGYRLYWTKSAASIRLAVESEYLVARN